MRIVIITDASKKQCNGVVTTMKYVVDNLITIGNDVLVLDAFSFPKIPFIQPYPDVDISIPIGMEKKIKDFKPDAIHIVTEFTLGWAAIRICLKNKWKFTTSYHTKIPEYLNKYYNFPLELGYKYVRKFHNYSSRVMVATESLYKELNENSFNNLVLWGRGVDTELFNISKKKDSIRTEKKFLYVGRVSSEKSIEDFLRLDLPGFKHIVGDGPDLKKLKSQYKDAYFHGKLTGENLANMYANCDMFVFPSKTDTFGLVILEALASGLPVAAYNVTGPKDIITDTKVGNLSDNLEEAIIKCFKCDPKECRKFAEKYNWTECTKIFYQNLVRINDI